MRMLCPAPEVRLPQAGAGDDHSVADRRGLLEAHARRLVRQRALLADADELGVRAGADAEDLVAHLELADGGPTASTTPASSMPPILFFGLRTPVKTREKNGWAARYPQSVRVIVVARTLTRTSPSFGTGRSTSSSRWTSGGPYMSCTTAFMPARPCE